MGTTSATDEALHSRGRNDENRLCVASVLRAGHVLRGHGGPLHRERVRAIWRESQPVDELLLGLEILDLVVVVLGANRGELSFQRLPLLRILEKALVKHELPVAQCVTTREIRL